jgi:hypothetical protein
MVHSVQLQNTSQIKEHLITAALTSDFPFPERKNFSRVWILPALVPELREQWGKYTYLSTDNIAIASQHQVEAKLA